MRRRLPGVLLLLTGGCSWSRFDTLSEHAPVVALRKPKDVGAGFGSSLTSVTTKDRVVLLASGSPGTARAASFELGGSDGPSVNAHEGDYCDSSESPCWLSSSPSVLQNFPLEGGGTSPLCFVMGAGSLEPASAASAGGVIVDCEKNRLRLLLPTPAEYGETLGFALENATPDVLATAADATAASFLVGAASAKLAWAYGARGATPELLLPPMPADESFGAVVASAAGAEALLYAVAAPGEGRVHLYRVAEEQTPEYWGCLPGKPGFGRSLSVGHVSKDAEPELVVSDDEGVRVFEVGKLLEAGGASEGCASDALAAASLFATLSCEPAADTGPCVDADFGAATAVGDLDGDGDGEVLIGAPRMGVRGVKAAGSVFVFDVESRGDATLGEIKYVSSAEEEDQLGSSLAAPRLEERNVIAAGAPGNGKVFVFYCSDLDSDSGGRCR